MNKTLFRKEALQKISSADDLQKFLTVVQPKHWLIIGICLTLATAVILWAFWGSITTVVTGEGIYLDLTRFYPITVPAKGHVITIHATLGEKIEKGQLIATIWDEEKNKNVDIFSPYTGFIADMYTSRGSPVIVEQVLGIIQQDLPGEYPSERFYCFVPAHEGDKIKKGMDVVLYPWGMEKGNFNGIKASVERISYIPASDYYFKSIYLNESFVKQLTKNVPLLPLIVTPKMTEKDHVYHFDWTSKQDQQELPLGSFVTAQVTIEERKPISFLFPMMIFPKNQSAIRKK